MVRVDIDVNSGFCFGVRRAIATLESHLQEGENLYCVGDIVHNEMEIERLRRKGLKVIEASELGTLHGASVLFRAHGEPPSSYETVERNGLQLTDATCPVVLKLQQHIREAYARMKAVGGQVVLFGKKGHAEVIGLMGQTGGECVLVEDEADICKVDPQKPVEVFAQTTKNPQKYAHIVELIRQRTRGSVTVNDTICKQMAGRADKIPQFASSHDMIVFVGGAKSSNSKVLFDICLGINSNSYFVTTEDDVRREWLTPEVGSVGIMGATSTPLWLMERVRDKVVGMLDGSEE